ncbi:discoidin domain-containing protein [Parapedobacter sp. 10938]|uniref:discoidin domain-containing protein n=1 Tax=Parapedobacter flavus TaxID=3110225 RepID=UPI002DBBCA0B|nr:discoidin domain-containing protein [Parapedobacter sp. 10938]MEC3881115.1 discoidin domain-containing protein [Parapedobacter sp. 10938]
MKLRIFPSICLGVAALAMACSDTKLEDFGIESGTPVTVETGAVADGITKTGETVTIRVGVTLSAPASKAFQVELQLNPDTVEQLAATGQLDGAFPFPSIGTTLPNVVNFTYGASESTFPVTFSITELEKFYGEKIAIAVDLVNPGKGNQLTSETTTLIVMNTTDLLAMEDIHYVSIANGGGGELEVRNRRNYTISSDGVNIPLGISLVGQPGRFFDVKSKASADTIQKLIADGTLPPNTVALTSEQFELDSSLRVSSNTSRGEMGMIVPMSVINENVDKVLAIQVEITETTRHLIDPEKSYVIVVIYPEFVIETDVTELGTLSVSRDNNGGPDNNEGSPKLVDNNINSKFLQSNFSGDLWVQLVFDEPQLVGAYTMTSANDAQTRDPKTWDLQGSMDGENWVTLDRRQDEEFVGRFQTKRYDFETNVAYTHYRLNITENWGSSLYQQAELRLIRVP